MRRTASALGQQVAAKPDSQDICFVPAGKYSDIVEKLRPGAAEAGDIVHMDGRVVGRHEGVIRYTIGQRRGLGVAMADRQAVEAGHLPVDQGQVEGPATDIGAGDRRK